jgi:hypothetical protein
MSDVGERYIRWYAYLPADASLDQHAARALLRRALADREALAEYLLNNECAPALLGEFIFRHWNDALCDALDSAALRLALRVIHAVWRTKNKRDLWVTLECFERGVVPSARVLRRLCKGVSDAR